MQPFLRLASTGCITLTNDSIKTVLNIVQRYILTPDVLSTKDWDEAVASLKLDKSMADSAPETLSPTEQAQLLFAAGLCILKTALRSRVTLDNLKQDLGLVLQLPNHLLDAFIDAWKGLSPKWAEKIPTLKDGNVPGSVIEHLAGVRLSSRSFPP